MLFGEKIPLKMLFWKKDPFKKYYLGIKMLFGKKDPFKSYLGKNFLINFLIFF